MEPANENSSGATDWLSLVQHHGIEPSFPEIVYLEQQKIVPDPEIVMMHDGVSHCLLKLELKPKRLPVFCEIFKLYPYRDIYCSGYPIFYSPETRILEKNTQNISPMTYPLQYHPSAIYWFGLHNNETINRIADTTMVDE
ncbi:hypothetical protein PCE1_002478 [Barthelona sp. PCE]